MEGSSNDPFMTLAERQVQALTASIQELARQSAINLQEMTRQNQELMQTLWKEVQTPSQVFLNKNRTPPRGEDGGKNHPPQDHEPEGSQQTP